MFKQYLVLEANAGSGKTFSLVSRYLTLLFDGVSPEKIFALTFTKKATKEMYDRVINSLKKPLDSGEVKLIAEDKNLSEKETIEKSAEILNRLLNSDIKISTIDSLNQSILKKFAHYLDILPTFRVVERIDEDRFKEQFLEALNGSKYRNNLLEIEKIDRSSKIDNLFSELQRFYFKQVELYDMKSHFLNLTVHNNLSAMEREILDLSMLIADWLLDDTHKLSKRAETALTFSNFEELLSKTWLQKSSLEEHRDFKKAFKDGGGDSVEQAFQRLKELLEGYFDRKRDLIFKNMFQLFEFYIENREEFIKREGKFSFDDINHFLVKLILDKKLDARFIYFRLDSTVEHFLIDEFQDTSLLQWAVLRPLIDDILSGGSSVDKSFFYVGDKVQSLYRFRGGFSELFDYVRDEYPQMEVETLPNNYRSKENLVNFVNALFGTKQTIGQDSQKGGDIYLQESEEPLLGGVERVIELINMGVSPDSIAVITSKNRDIDKLAELLENRGVDVVAETNQPLSAHPTVQAVTQYLLYLYHIRDERAIFYLKNFQAVTGVHPKESCKRELPISYELLNTLSLYEIGVKIIKEFQLFDGDENTIRFLESLNGYNDIDDFIYSYHLEAGKVSKSDKKGVNLITIHKSKGLEFPYVVFIDYSNRKGGGFNTPKNLIKYNKIETVDLLWRISSDNKIYQRFLDAKESEDELEKSDLFNRLYVALTRAKKSLSIIKKEEKSALDEIGLSDIDLSRYSGDLETEHKSVEESLEEDSGFILDFQENHYGYQNEIENVEDEEIDIDFSLDEQWENYEKMEFGSALHSTVEIMNSFDRDALDVAIENVRNRYSHNLPSESFNEIYRRVENMINDSDFLSLIADGEVLKESSYIYRGKNYYMDMVIEKDDEVIVCDFKSSDNWSYRDKYIKQVKNYMTILRDIDNKNRQIKGYLLYPTEQGFRKTEVF